MDKKLSKIIDDRQLTSAMNKTKWRELCVDFETQHELNISVRYKLITSNDILGPSPVYWNELFEEAIYIEWIDFDPITKEHTGRLTADKETDRSNEILSILNKHGIRYSMHGSYFRIWGYLSSGAHPKNS